MLTFEEIYDRIYQPGWDQAAQQRAQDELTHLSDEEWRDWIEYRRRRISMEIAGERW